MRKEQVIKILIGLGLFGIILYFALFYAFNNMNMEPAEVIVNNIVYKTNNVSIQLPKVAGDEKISSIIEEINDKWRAKADKREVEILNVSITYYDENYLSILYNGQDTGGNKVIDTVVIDLVKRRVMGKGEIVDVALKSKFEAEGKEDPKMRYPDSTFNQFSNIYLEKGADGTINCVFCWKKSGSTKYNTSKLNGYEIIKSIV
jgi:hypothetical protein